MIPPGKPFKNGYIESFHSRMREELLDAELFKSPYSTLGRRTPFEVFKKVGQLDMRKSKCNIISVQKWGAYLYFFITLSSF